MESTTMADYIKRDDALNVLCDMCEDNWICDETDKQECEFHSKLMDIPAADVRVIVRGEWVFEERANQHRCSVCGCDDYGRVQQDGAVWFNHYCPNCGADMRQKTERSFNNKMKIAEDFFGMLFDVAKTNQKESEEKQNESNSLGERRDMK